MRLLSLLLIASLLLFSSTLLAADEEKDGAEETKTVAYYELSPSIVVNVKGKAKYMRCEVQLMTKDDTKLPNIARHAPALRHELLLLLSDQKGQNIQGTRGKEKLRKVALKALRGVMKKLAGDESIDDLFFTTYFVQ